MKHLRKFNELTDSRVFDTIYDNLKGKLLFYFKNDPELVYKDNGTNLVDIDETEMVVGWKKVLDIISSWEEWKKSVYYWTTHFIFSADPRFEKVINGKKKRQAPWGDIRVRDKKKMFNDLLNRYGPLVVKKID